MISDFIAHWEFVSIIYISQPRWRKNIVHRHQCAILVSHLTLHSLLPWYLFQHQAKKCRTWFGIFAATNTIRHFSYTNIKICILRQFLAAQASAANVDTLACSALFVMLLHHCPFFSKYENVLLALWWNFTSRFLQTQLIDVGLFPFTSPN